MRACAIIQDLSERELSQIVPARQNTMAGSIYSQLLIRYSR
jgi:hypothetical protein